MANTDVLVDSDTTTRTAMRPPSKFNVILFNDDSTTVEFVVLLLMSIFHKSFEDASYLTMSIHKTGRGVAGTHSHEIATQKRDEAITTARMNGYPLRVEIEES